jgi:hypothetical protein
MLQTSSGVAGVFVAALLVAATLEPAPPVETLPPLTCAAGAADGQDPRPHCCFTNARYVGTCEIEPAQDETCAAILEYLNNPQSQGKAYCNSTAIRGGWKQVPCQPKMEQD